MNTAKRDNVPVCYEFRGWSSRICDAYMLHGLLPHTTTPPSYPYFKKCVKINFHFMKSKIRHVSDRHLQEKILKYLLEFWSKNDQLMDRQRKYLSTLEPVSVGLPSRDALSFSQTFPVNYCSWLTIFQDLGLVQVKTKMDFPSHPATIWLLGDRLTQSREPIRVGFHTIPNRG